MKKFGFIGAGNMGSAIIDAIIRNDIVKGNEIVVYDVDTIKVNDITKKYNTGSLKNLKNMPQEAEIIFLAVKPNIIYDVINEIKDKISNDTIFVSIAAGQSIEKLEKAFEKKVKLMRVMPNTPTLVGAGMSALCPNSLLQNDEEKIEFLKKVFSSFGVAMMIEEKHFDAVTGVSGSSPAYVYMFIEALADAGVAQGLPRDKSYTFAAQSVLGAAKMVIDTKFHPGVLKDMVCSPGGTTIEAVRVLEERGFRSAVIEAVNACAEKSKELS